MNSTYKILRASTMSSLERNVNEELKLGYTLVGGVSFDSKELKYMQAINLEGTENDK